MSTPGRGDQKDLEASLRAALDAGAEPLAPDDARAMRVAVVAAAVEHREARGWWRPLALAATILLMLAAGSAAGRKLELRQAEMNLATEAAPMEGEPRQLQFATPGGTRIIWVFNSDLSLNATRP